MPTTIAFVNAVSGQGLGALTRSVTLSTTVNNKVIVGVLSSQTPVTAITDTVGTTYAKKAGANTLLNVELWSGIAAGTNAANSITVTIAGVAGGVRLLIAAAQYSGVSSEGSTIASMSLNPTTLAPWGPTLTVQDANNFLVGVLGIRALNPTEGDPGMTQSTGTLETTIQTVIGSRYRIGIVDNTSVTPGSVSCLVTSSTDIVTGIGYSAVGLALELKTLSPIQQPFIAQTMSSRLASALNSPRL